MRFYFIDSCHTTPLTQDGFFACANPKPPQDRLLYSRNPPLFLLSPPPPPPLTPSSVTLVISSRISFSLFFFSFLFFFDFSLPTNSMCASASSTSTRPLLQSFWPPLHHVDSSRALFFSPDSISTKNKSLSPPSSLPTIPHCPVRTSSVIHLQLLRASSRLLLFSHFFGSLSLSCSWAESRVFFFARPSSFEELYGNVGCKQ